MAAVVVIRIMISEHQLDGCSLFPLLVSWPIIHPVLVSHKSACLLSKTSTQLEAVNNRVATCCCRFIRSSSDGGNWNNNIASLQ